MPRPSAIPPAATTGTGATASTTAGTSGNVEIRPVWPPASVPCAVTTSTPASAARRAPSTVRTWHTHDRSGVVRGGDERRRVRERVRDDPHSLVERDGHELRGAGEMADEPDAERTIGQLTGEPDLRDQPVGASDGRAADESETARFRYRGRESAGASPPPIGALSTGYSISNRSHNRVHSTGVTLPHPVGVVRATAQRSGGVGSRLAHSDRMTRREAAELFEVRAAQLAEAARAERR